MIYYIAYYIYACNSYKEKRDHEFETQKGFACLFEGKKGIGAMMEIYYYSKYVFNVF